MDERASKPTKRTKRKFVVSFDEESRREYITGGHKRKRQRQLQALTKEMQEANERKREERREKREATKQALIERGFTEPEEKAAVETAKVKIDDDFSSRAFGEAAVTVETTDGLPDESEEDDEDVEVKPGNGQMQPQALTKKHLRKELKRRLREKKVRKRLAKRRRIHKNKQASVKR